MSMEHYWGSFFQKLSDNFRRVLDYEKDQLKEKARRSMNIDVLRSRAQNKIKSLKLDDSDFDDIFLLEILSWFKNEFFSWMDKPTCCKCGGVTASSGAATPTPAELLFKANRVEDYVCEACSAHTRFPRYNDPGKLLETRTGRCGEWANCFVLCCRAVGFETRYVLDFTDHVWAEVFSKKQCRWLHCDPCENVCDKPLLYEAGWGKKLTYVIAFSLDNIQDVTWRYSSNHSVVLQRRRECNEEWLVWAICKLRLERYKEISITSSAAETLNKRTAIELVELMNQSSSHSKNLPGRTTGSVAWRMARGELGSEHPTAPYIIKPNDSELKNNCLEITYNCSEDSYTRGNGVDSEVISGWGSHLFEAKDVFRKVEQDWKKAYICRQENTFVGTLTWKIDLSGTGKRLDALHIYVGCECFENGKVLWKVLSNSGLEKEINPNEERTLDGFSDSKIICLTAILSGGKGANAWQHSQIFRQDLNTSALPFRLRLTFEDRIE